jgi:hypothetical protein
MKFFSFLFAMGMTGLIFGALMTPFAPQEVDPQLLLEKSGQDDEKKIQLNDLGIQQKSPFDSVKRSEDKNRQPSSLGPAYLPYAGENNPWKVWMYGACLTQSGRWIEANHPEYINCINEEKIGSAGRYRHARKQIGIIVAP